MAPVKLVSRIGPVLFAAILITSAQAGAQTKEQKAGARAAADAGADAFDAGNYAEAADLFERAERLVHAPPHLLYAARAHTKLGHLVEARELYLTLTRERLPANAPRAFRDAQQAGEKELADVEPRIAYVSVVVQGEAAAGQVSVTRNGEPIAAELLGVPAPTNPGSYEYQASVEGMTSSVASIKVTEGSKETVLLTLKGKPAAASSGSQAPSGGEASAAGSLQSSDASESSGGRPLLIGAIAGFGVAVVGGVVGGVFLSKSSDSAAKADAMHAQCEPCTYEDKALIDPIDQDAASQKAIGIVGLVGAGVGLAAGVTLLVLDLNRDTRSEAAHVMPIVGWNYAGVAGRF
jgi:hypothetical protein